MKKDVPLTYIRLLQLSDVPGAAPRAWPIPGEVQCGQGGSVCSQSRRKSSGDVGESPFLQGQSLRQIVVEREECHEYEQACLPDR